MKSAGRKKRESLTITVSSNPVVLSNNRNAIDSSAAPNASHLPHLATTKHLNHPSSVPYHASVPNHNECISYTGSHLTHKEPQIAFNSLAINHETTTTPSTPHKHRRTISHNINRDEFAQKDHKHKLQLGKEDDTALIYDESDNNTTKNQQRGRKHPVTAKDIEQAPLLMSRGQQYRPTHRRRFSGGDSYNYQSKKPIPLTNLKISTQNKATINNPAPSNRASNKAKQTKKKDLGKLGLKERYFIEGPSNHLLESHPPANMFKCMSELTANCRKGAIQAYQLQENPDDQKGDYWVNHHIIRDKTTNGQQYPSTRVNRPEKVERVPIKLNRFEDHIPQQSSNPKDQSNSRKKNKKKLSQETKPKSSQKKPKESIQNSKDIEVQRKSSNGKRAHRSHDAQDGNGSNKSPDSTRGHIKPKKNKSSKKDYVSGNPKNNTAIPRQVLLAYREQPVWDQNIPYPMDFVLQYYKQWLHPSEIAEIKSVETIYYIRRSKPKIEAQPGKNKVEQAIRCKVNNHSQEDEVLESLHPTSFQGGIDIQTAPQSRQSKPVSIGTAENTGQFYHYLLNDHIAYRYEVLAPISRGSFGEVVKVKDHRTGETLAMKIIKNNPELRRQIYVEISILAHIKEADQNDACSIIQIKDFTLFRSHFCLLFQLLDGNLYELLAANQFKGLRDHIVKIFAIQILTMLHFLQGLHIIHCDIKPQNLLLKKWGKTGLKLIDFGTSCYEGKQLYSYLQSRFYRAPEIILEQPYSHPIDLWSFGCLIAQLKLGEPLFETSDDLTQIVCLFNCIGPPEDTGDQYSAAILETILIRRASKDLELETHMAKDSQRCPPDCLLPLATRLANKGCHDRDFLEFLLVILQWNPAQRPSASKLLSHPWLRKDLPAELLGLQSLLEMAQEPKMKNFSQLNQVKDKSLSKSRPKSPSQPPNSARSSGPIQEMILRKRAADQNPIKNLRNRQPRRQ